MTISIRDLIADVNPDLFDNFIAAVHNRRPVQGFTHNFYRYPARFSPLFARTAIEAFTEPGDIVLDPFMGGGTTLVEARLLGRQGIGTDISSLATFVSQVKTTTLSGDAIAGIRSWAAQLNDKLNLRNPPQRALAWIEHGYQHNINSKQTWPLRKTLELALADIDNLPTIREEVRKLSEEIQRATGENVELAYVDQGYTGERASGFAAEHGIRLEVVKHEEAKRGFVLLPRRWVVERDFAWASRFRRLVKDYERLPDTVAGLHFVAFACLFLQQAVGILSAGS